MPRPPDALRPIETTCLGKITGAGSLNRTDERFGIHGTDLGILWDGGGGRIFVLFGDTYGAGWGGDGAGPAHADWRYNTLAFSTNGDLDNGLLLDGVIERSDGLAGQLLAGDRVDEVTIIPNSGITIDGVQYMHYMSVREWGPPGQWTTNYAGIAVSTDNGMSWSRAGQWPNNERRAQKFQLGAFTSDAEHVYLFGTTNGRFDDAFLARVRPDSVADTAAYEYYDGSGWTEDHRAAAAVISGPIGELSVGYQHYFGRWIAVHLDEHRAAIVLRTADEPTGPWSEGQVLVSGQDYPALYGGYLHPWSLHGADIHYLISQWGPYNVYHMRSKLA